MPVAILLRQMFAARQGLAELDVQRTAASSSSAQGPFSFHRSTICGGGNGDYGPHLPGRLLRSTSIGLTLALRPLRGRPDVPSGGGCIPAVLARKRPRKLIQKVERWVVNFEKFFIYFSP